MGRQFLSALLLAQGASAFLDRLVNINAVNVHVIELVVAAASTTDPGLLACDTAGYIVSSCSAAGSLASTVPTASLEACLCCYKGAELAFEYSSCASYIANSVPKSTDAFTLASGVYSICAGAGTQLCDAAGGGGGGGGGGGSTPKTSAVSSATRVASSTKQQAQTTAAAAAPAGCTSLINVYSSCSENVPNFTAQPASKLASCFCYDGSGTYNTKFDDYASSCAPWAKTADPTDYSLIQVFETFCAAFPPSQTAAGGAASTTPKSNASGSVGSGSGGGGGFASIAGGGSSSSSTGGSGSGGSDTSSTTSRAAVTVTRSVAFAAPAAAPAGVITWVANLATFVLSFFFLI
ncbi:hypothetical protein QBC46DRAFT_139199 [Diplogelasinospora grovesii]|uniref:Uncharacterized protein n=1 Tax=Diplogelasinospora grovesii TaxID=303347 RepID=A0AAN6N8T0_9PEZI|nr:hypothetical protein QBC46DRAFT_139199 [Diplogelasinospora grovesii]